MERAKKKERKKEERERRKHFYEIQNTLRYKVQHSDVMTMRKMESKSNNYNKL